LIFVIYGAITLSQKDWIRLVAVTSYTTLLPTLVIKLAYKEKLRSRFGLRKDQPLVQTLYCAATIAMVSFSIIMVVLFENHPLNLLNGLVVAPIVEEIFLRGYLLGNISKSNKHVGVGVSALLFGAAHFMTIPATVADSIQVFLAGLVLGYAFLLSESILIPIIYHQAWNILLSGFYLRGPFWSFIGYLIYYAPINAVVVTIYGYVMLERRRKATRGCWICRRNVEDLKKAFPQAEDVMKEYSIEEGRVKVCLVCERLHSIALEEEGKKRARVVQNCCE
jgi:membrane protease YdiL (CAAX protease family)